MSRVVRSFSLDLAVQTRLDALLANFETDARLLPALMPSTAGAPSATLVPPKPDTEGLVSWEAQFTYNQALKRAEKLVIPPIKMNCSLLVSALLALGMDILQERVLQNNKDKETPRTARPQRTAVSAGR